MRQFVLVGSLLSLVGCSDEKVRLTVPVDGWGRLRRMRSYLAFGIVLGLGCGSEVSLGTSTGTGGGGFGGSGVVGVGTSSVASTSSSSVGGAGGMGSEGGGGQTPVCDVILHETFAGPVGPGWPAAWTVTGTGLVDVAGGQLVASSGSPSEAFAQLPATLDELEVRVRFRFDPNTDQVVLLGLRGTAGALQNAPLSIQLGRWFGQDSSYLSGTVVADGAAKQWLASAFLPTPPPQGDDVALWLRVRLTPRSEGSSFRLGLRVWPATAPEPVDDELLDVEVGDSGTGFSVGASSTAPTAAPIDFEEIMVCRPSLE